MAHIRNLVAALAILGMLGCLALVFHAGSAMNRTIGPSALAVGTDGRLHVASHGRLHVFDAAGTRVAKTDLEPLAGPLIVSDIAVLGDGRVLLADPDGPALVRCSPGRSPCERLALDLAAHTREHLVAGNAFKLFVDETRQRIYLSDNAGHRLVIADLEGRVLAASAARKDLHFPNKLWLSAPDRVDVVDTNHRRIATFDVSGDRVGPVVGQLRLDATGIARPGRAWPFAAAVQPDGERWVLLARDGMKDADVVAFGEDGKARRRVDLGADSDPFAIARFGDRTIVADATNYRLLAIPAGAGPAAEFGDAAFRGELAEARAVRERWVHARTGAQAGVVLAPLLGIFFLWRLGVPLQAPARQPIAAPGAGQALPLGREVRWLEVDPAFIERQSRLLGRAAWAFGLGLAAMAAFAVLAFGEALQEPRVRNLGILTAIMAVAAVALGVAMPGRMRRRVPATRLGASRDGLHFRVPDVTRLSQEAAPREGVARWQDVHFDGRRLLVGREVIVVKLPVGGELFDRDRLAGEILAHVPAANRIGALGLEIRAVRAGNRLLAASWIAAALILAIMLASHLLR